MASTALSSEQYLTNFVCLENVFSPEDCQRLIYIDIPASQAHVTRFKGSTFNQLQMNSRNTKVKAIARTPEHQWVYDRLIQYVQYVNRECFHFRLQKLTEPQILEYENTGFYGCHLDIGTGDTSRRKISMVVFLTPPEQYEGGQLILQPHFPAIVQKQGSAVFFPSYLPHEITPVTSGVRHTLVTWVLGPCFR